MATKTITTDTTVTASISLSFVELEALIAAAAGVAGARVSFKAVKQGFTSTDFAALQSQGYTVSLVLENATNDPGTPETF